MDSIERAKRAFHFNKPDRVPKVINTEETDFYAFSCLQPLSFQPKEFPPHLIGGNGRYASEVYYQTVNQYRWKEEYRKKLKLPEDWWNHEQNNQVLTIDEWGIIWKSGALNRDPTMGHPYKGPFQNSWDNYDNYNFPDPYDGSRYRNWNTFHQESSSGKYIGGILMLAFIHNLTSFLRGFNLTMIDFRKNPNKLHELINRITDFFCVQVQLMKENCPQLDAIMIFDDLGTQQSPFLSPNTFRKFFYNGYKKVIDLTHDLDMDFVMHCCGQIKELLPVFSELGIDVMEFDSPRMTGVDNFKKYAEQQKIAFLLSSDIQSTFIFGTPKEIEEEVKTYVKEVGNNFGGLGFYAYPGDQVLQAPKENLIIFFESMKKWGNYNKDGIIDWLATK